MRRRHSFQKEMTDKKASNAFEKILSGHLVRATNHDTQKDYWGIVVSFDSIQEKLENMNDSKVDTTEWKNSIWAMWTEKSKDEAVRLYESIYDHEFVPRLFAGGSLICLSPRDHEFEIIDEDEGQTS